MFYSGKTKLVAEVRQRSSSNKSKGGKDAGSANEVKPKSSKKLPKSSNLVFDNVLTA
jgi:hypothetical protein